MDISIATNGCAFILFIALICSFFQNKLWTSSDKIFFILLIICSFCSFTDLIFTLTSTATHIPITILRLNIWLYFLFRNITPFAYLCYIISISDAYYIASKNKILWVFTRIPIIFSILMIATNPLTHGIFTYSNNYIYHRGFLLPVLYTIAAYYLFLSVFYIKKYGESITIEKKIAIYMFLPLSLGSVFIQFLFPTIAIEMFSTAICMMLVMFTIQKKEEVLEGSTGLWNRSIFMQHIHKRFFEKKQFTIISINISNLKSLNQAIGRMAVDTILNDVSQYIKSFYSQTNGLYAMGNGKFNILFLDKDKDKIEEIASKLNTRFQSLWSYHALELNLLAYIAVINCPQDVSNKDDLLKFTDEFHKYTKFSGTVLHIQNLNSQQMKRNEELEHIIEKALLEKRFEVYYQPIYSIKEDAITSAEALLRLYDETYGFISPDEFIPVAEANMSILKIGDFVLETVCKFIASHNLKQKGIKYIEINLSVVQCMQANMGQHILETIQRYGVKPSQINLEITETATIYSQETMMKNMKLLRENGIYFSLDDYGSGYSNLNYLVSFPFALIKLDKGIVCSQSMDPKKWIALKYSIEMLLEMGCQIVAEGVETKEMLQDLSNQGCQYIQGYYFSKAIPDAAFLEYISQYNNVSINDISILEEDGIRVSQNEF